MVGSLVLSIDEIVGIEIDLIRTVGRRTAQTKLIGTDACRIQIAVVVDECGVVEPIY